MTSQIDLWYRCLDAIAKLKAAGKEHLILGVKVRFDDWLWTKCKYTR